MNALTDQQLLQEYALSHSEGAFAELVRRHIDLVYSAALRMIRDAHQAQDVTQAVFVALAQNAQQLTRHPILSGWLHRTTQHLAANAVRTNVRRQTREQEAAAMNELLSAGPDVSWEHIAPHLDAALGELSEPDRDAVLLRYFEKKSAQEMAEGLGISDKAAQKRVSRAVERLREFFAKRGVTVGTSGLIVLISANTVQAAPVGLAITISTAAATVAGTALATTAIATATKTVAMTTLQKAIIGTTLAVAAGAGIYEARQASQLRDQVQALQQQQAPLSEQILQLERERNSSAQRIAALQNENQRLNNNTTELLKLRGTVGALKRQLAETTKTSVKVATSPQDDGKTFTPEEASKQEGIAKMTYARDWLLAFHEYAAQNNGQFPTNFDQAANWLRDGAKTEANLQEHEFLPATPEYGLTPDHYEIMYQGSLAELSNAPAIIIIREKEPWQTPDGSWVRAYGFADGHSEIHKATDGNFEAWEAKHMMPRSSPP